MRYYINTIRYFNSELKAADKFILQFLKAYEHFVVTRRWADDAMNWIAAKLEAYYKANPRVGRILIGSTWPDKSRYSVLPYPMLNIGAITITLLPVEADLDIFEVPMFPHES